jgi:hypothetical protein
MRESPGFRKCPSIAWERLPPIDCSAPVVRLIFALFRAVSLDMARLLTLEALLAVLAVAGILALGILAFGIGLTAPVFFAFALQLVFYDLSFYLRKQLRVAAVGTVTGVVIVPAKYIYLVF